MNDATSFFLAFTAVFGGIVAYTIRLERQARILEARIRTLEGIRTLEELKGGKGQ